MATTKLFFYDSTHALALTCPACGTPVTQGVTHKCENGKPVAATAVRKTAAKGAKG
jgi:hypothetical protein